MNSGRREGWKERRRERKITMAASLEKALQDHYAVLIRGLFLKGFYNSSVSEVVLKHLLDAIK